MIKYIFILLMMIGVSGCGQSTQVVSSPNPTVDTLQDDINYLVYLKNVDRLLTAQAPLTSGLSCVVQQVSSGQCLNTSSVGCSGLGLVMTGTSYTYLYKGLFNQPDSSSLDTNTLLPAALQPLFTNKNFRVVCSGSLVITKSDYYEFDLTSDDGSILTLDGSQVVNNDNNHGMTTRSGVSLLYRGVHTFALQYAQTGGGNYGLILLSNGQNILINNFYH